MSSVTSSTATTLPKRFVTLRILNGAEMGTLIFCQCRVSDAFVTGTSGLPSRPLGGAYRLAGLATWNVGCPRCQIAADRLRVKKVTREKD